MLALKTIFSKHQGVTSLIFDEVDTGVSGSVAQAIAEKIAMIATHSQVLVYFTFTTSRSNGRSSLPHKKRCRRMTGRRTSI